MTPASPVDELSRAYAVTRGLDPLFERGVRQGGVCRAPALGHLRKEHKLGDKNILGALAEYMIRDRAHAKWKMRAKRRRELKK